MPDLKRSRTNKVYDWGLWKTICEEAGYDPHETVEIGEDIGGGDSVDYEFAGDIPEREVTDGPTEA